MEWGLPPWIHTKIGLVILLVIYHLWCGHLRKQLFHEKCNWSGKHFRIFNEIPTLLLVTIVFLVVFKEALSWSIFLLILAGMILTIIVTVLWLAKRRGEVASVNNRD
jgi:putative membrane protein